MGRSPHPSCLSYRYLSYRYLSLIASTSVCTHMINFTKKRLVNYTGTYFSYSLTYLHIHTHTHKHIQRYPPSRPFPTYTVTVMAISELITPRY